MIDRSYRFGFVVEYALGHVTFANMLQAAVDADPEVTAEWFFLPPELQGWLEHVPPFSRNSTMLHSLRTLRQVGRRRRHLDAVLIHTQTAALLTWPMTRTLPIVVSTDATPANFDEISAAYGHGLSRPAMEAVKRGVTGAALRQSAAVMPWSRWVARSMVEDYGVVESRVNLIRPGIYPDKWAPKTDYGRDGHARFLFVGAEFRRKGGDTLLQALDGLQGDWHLDVVTKSRLPASPRMRVFNDIDHGDERMSDIYRAADVFVLPTEGDAYGWAILEAMAAGLPTVATSVGAIPEIVLDGETGYLLRPHDPVGLRSALERLLESADLRRRLGTNARSVFMTDHNADTNMPSILEMLKRVSRVRDPSGAS
jgi:glycosyltransferase involved in cell wall biosynthesis